MRSPTDLLGNDPVVSRAVASLLAGRPAEVGGLLGSAPGLFLAAVAARFPEPILAVASDAEEAEDLLGDLLRFGAAALPFPARETGSGGADAEPVRLRLGAVEALRARREPPSLLVAPILALLQPVTTEEAWRRSLLEMRVGSPLRPEEILLRLAESGFERVPLVGSPGEMSLRGDILDLFPFATGEPIRVELLDERIESIRTFDPDSQRSTARHDRLLVSTARDPGFGGEGPLLPEVLGPGALVARLEPVRLRDREEALRLEDPAYGPALDRLARAIAPLPSLDLRVLPTGAEDLEVRPLHDLGVGVREAGAALRRAAAREGLVVVLCTNEAERRRLEAVLADQGLATGDGTIRLEVGPIAQGFRLPAHRIALVNHRELLGAPAVRRPLRLPRHGAGRAIASFFDLREGDLVVHAVHGLAKFLRIERVSRKPGEEDCLLLEFDEGTLLYLPASRIDLVSRYVGAGGARPRLDRIGGSAFAKRKEAVRRALIDLASDLLEVQAMRESSAGFAFPADDSLQRDFEASFPYPDTEDQAEACAEIRADMEVARPMDRLLCGDVGYGKTELAVRAAFKAVNAGKQVALLVPTTVLAQQHFATFRERLADYPVEVEVLSRFRTDREIRGVLERTARGAVDVLIGTHRLLSGDVAFRDLGLVLIDEEQRFGVGHKERFKRLRSTVDVLTLTATPIPRTLHMSLVGIRDISSLATPPVGRRDIETVVLYEDDDAAIREGILRERNRGGQVFFLHNRVRSIERVARRLRALVPGVRIEVAHGQMAEGALEARMVRFVSGEVDVLVSTTIVESGLDIPRANTIFVHDAHTFGLAELHQLRGRVGRWVHKAYCFLLLPRRSPLSAKARARLKSIAELRHLGAGFAIAMRDLEIRGAGNLLGAEQSGHIGAVGYDLYCRLLRATVARLRGERSEALEAGDEAVEVAAGIRAFLPPAYVPDGRLRLEILHELDAIEDLPSRARAEASLRDRFGPLPPEVQALLDLFLLKRALRRLRVRSLSYAGDRYVVEHEDRVLLEAGLRPAFPDMRFVRPGICHLVLPPGERHPDAALARLLNGVRQAGSGTGSAEPETEPDPA